MRSTTRGTPYARPWARTADRPRVLVRQHHPGLWLLLHTDGIVEARDAEGRRFGRERFADFVVRHQHRLVP
ncbi:SpoIIE family protein phosphatase [Streptomyces canus]|uniref:SpoIIE family protein phosphatase n=1 Tax=Streptomyces canus TaxID=58343 RepID=UPI002DDA49A0|nr:SpoIIE family protein phosphatase [Streptomyces canus]